MEPVRLFEILTKASAVLVTAGFAAVVLGHAPRRSQNRYLAAFLLLISANQLMETLIGLRKVEHEIGMLADLLPPLSMTGLDRLALLFAASDPFVLYYFASIYPKRTRLNHPLPVALVAAGSLSFLLLAQDFVLARDRWLVLAWEAFTASVYLVVWAHFAGPLVRREPLDGARPLHYAMCVAALPVVPRVGRAVALAFELGFGMGEALLVVIGPSVILVVGLLLADRLWWRSTGHAISKGALLGGLVILIGFLPWFMRAPPLLYAFYTSLPGLPWYQASAALRWLLFSLLASVAVFRHDILGMRLEARRRAGRGAVVFAAALGTVFLYTTITVLATGSMRTRPLDIMIVGTILVLSPDLRRFIAGCADRLYGVPATSDKGAAAATYRTAVLQARRDGRELSDDPDLRRLRRALGLTPETASWIEGSTVHEPPPARGLEVGTAFQGRYLVRAFLGRGGAGRTFLARDPLLNRDVALKEVPETTRTQGEHVLRESQAAAKVHHPHVVAIHDVVPQAGRIIMVTEYLAESLDERVARDGPLALEEATRVFGNVLSGLEAVHGAGLVHRDLKPANILLAHDGAAKIGDFGIATDASAVTLTPGDAGLSGTPAYLAPEVLADGIITPLVDIYAVARMMRFCLDEDAQAALDSVIARGAAPEPADRYDSAHAMLADLQAAAAAALAREAAALGPSTSGTGGRHRRGAPA